MDRDEEYSEDEFRKIVVELVKDKDILGENGRLSDEQMKRVDSKVFAHIATVLDVELDPDTNSYSPKSRPSAAAAIREWLFGSFGHAAIAVCSVVTVGALTFYVLNEKTNSVLPELPDTLTLVGVDRYALPSADESLGFVVGRTLTERREAFLIGVAQAGVDISDNSELDRAIADNYRQYMGGSGTGSEDTQWLEEKVSVIGSSNESREWLIWGYTTEVLNLVARGSIENLDFTSISTALMYYQSETPVIDDSTNVSKQAIENHGYLMSVTASEVDSPDDIKTIIDRTKNLKVVID